MSYTYRALRAVGRLFLAAIFAILFGAFGVVFGIPFLNAAPVGVVVAVVVTSKRWRRGDSVEKVDA